MTFEKIKQVVDEWDPIGLLAMGAPENEYYFEVKELFDKLNNNFNVSDVSEIIYDIFIKRFGRDTFTESLDKCKEISNLILE